MRKFFRKLHLWVSVPFGIVITVTCFTGALLVFEKEVTALCYSDVATVEPAGEPLPLEKLLANVGQSLPADTEITGVVVSQEPSEAYMVNLSKPRRAAVYVNQYTGEVTGSYERLGFFQTVLRLHRWLLDTRPQDGGIYWGKVIVGASTIAFVVILLTGLFIWWPRGRKMASNRLKIVFSKGKNRFLHDLHVAGGFYALLFLLAMALTGLTWSYEWYRDGFYSMFENSPTKAVASSSSAVKFSSTKDNNPKALKGTADGVTSATASSVNGVSGATVTGAASEHPYASWSKALAHVLNENPSYSQITVSAGEISVKPAGWGNSRAADKYTFEPSTGEVLSVQRYSDTSSLSRARGWVYSIHTGAWGGIFIKILYFLAALLGATLAPTGYYFWIKRLYNKK